MTNTVAVQPVINYICDRGQLLRHRTDTRTGKTLNPSRWSLERVTSLRGTTEMRQDFHILQVADEGKGLAVRSRGGRGGWRNSFQDERRATLGIESKGSRRRLT